MDNKDIMEDEYEAQSEGLRRLATSPLSRILEEYRYKLLKDIKIENNIENGVRSK